LTTLKTPETPSSGVTPMPKLARGPRMGFGGFQNLGPRPKDFSAPAIRRLQRR
jgi:hypothetical protein